jgi:hypothetical protein
MYLPPNLVYAFYTLLEGTRGEGALELRAVRSGGNGATRDLGDVVLGPSHTVSGRIVRTDGRPFLDQAEFNISREWARDTLLMNTETDGTFLIANIPHNESLTIMVRMPGYRLAQSNRFQQLRDNTFAIHVDRSRDDLEILLEPVPVGN